MAATTRQIRLALKAALDDPSTGVSGWQTSAYMLSSPQPPAIDIRPAGTTFDVAMARGLDDLRFTIRAMVAYNNDQGAQVRLDELLDTTSATGIKTVLEQDPTLGGLVQYIRVTEISDYKALIIDSIVGATGMPPMLAVEITVEVYP